ncbi:hypothetical protein RFI_39640, partial [Reticulomyxa filosa]
KEQNKSKLLEIQKAMSELKRRLKQEKQLDHCKKKSIINWSKMKSINWNEYHQREITEEEVIETLRHISMNKAQGPDNIHNQMIKNGGQAMIDSLVLLFDWSFRIRYAQIIEEGEYCPNTETR